ncbi:MAG TPA: hypothetical protein PLE19_20860 [Planctomycetota bacterium]|mgnify:FL=1|jgi:hypothetical protein|nr:hypothetical protein [Planctomycetota bacterium]
MALIADIAEAVVTALNGHTFSQPFTAARAYRPVFDLKDLTDLHVTVVPKGVELTTAGRGLAQSDVQIDIGVQKKLTASDNAGIDPLLGLVQEIAEFVRATGRFGDAAWVKTENTPIYSQEHLGELRQFTSVLTLTLRLVTA